MEVTAVRPVPFTLGEIALRYKLNRKIIVPQRRSGRFGEKKSLFPLPRMGPSFYVVQAVVR